MGKEEEFKLRKKNSPCEKGGEKRQAQQLGSRKGTQIFQPQQNTNTGKKGGEKTGKRGF